MSILIKDTNTEDLQRVLLMFSGHEIVEIFDHGDLIDAEEQLRLMQACEYDTYDDYNRAFDMLDNAPTVIPAERSEK